MSYLSNVGIHGRERFAEYSATICRILSNQLALWASSNRVQRGAVHVFFLVLVVCFDFVFSTSGRLTLRGDGRFGSHVASLLICSPIGFNIEGHGPIDS